MHYSVDSRDRKLGRQVGTNALQAVSLLVPRYLIQTHLIEAEKLLLPLR
jgi:hypothetical protein